MDLFKNKRKNNRPSLRISEKYQVHRLYRCATIFLRLNARFVIAYKIRRYSSILREDLAIYFLKILEN